MDRIQARLYRYWDDLQAEVMQVAKEELHLHPDLSLPDSIRRAKVEVYLHQAMAWCSILIILAFGAGLVAKIL